MKFRKKPVIIDAYKYEGNGFAAMTWASTLIDGDNPIRIDSKQGLVIFTLEGVMHVSEGDWIIQGVEGEFYSCKDRIFRKTYERVEE